MNSYSVYTHTHTHCTSTVYEQWSDSIPCHIVLVLAIMVTLEYMDEWRFFENLKPPQFYTLHMTDQEACGALLTFDLDPLQSLCFFVPDYPVIFGHPFC